MESCGYEDKLFVTEPLEYLRCGICRLVLRNPVQLLQCGHKYCSECFQRIKGLAERNDRHLRCPLDRELVDVTRICEDIALKRMVSSLPVKCLLADSGCSWTGELSDMKTHQEKCERVQVVPQPSVDNSKVMALIGGLSGRIESCEHSLVEKDKEISHLKLTISKMKTEHGDSLEQLRKEINEMLGNTMKELNTQSNVLRKRVDAAETQLNKKQQQIDEVEKKVVGLEGKVESTQTRKRVDAAETQLNKNRQQIDKVEKKVVGLEREVESTQTKAKQGQMDSVPRGLEGASGEVIVNTVKEVKTKKNYAMKVHKHIPPSNVVISNGNTIHFKNMWSSTITLPDAVVPKGVKTWYEVKDMEFNTFDGSLRVGWCCDKGLPSEGELFRGIGSNQFSYCFYADQTRYCKQHNCNSRTWGKRITVNDVIGVAFDAVDGQILFSLNGRWDLPMGVAFEGVDATMGFYPAVTGRDSKVHVNCGEGDFTFGPPDRTYKKLIDL